MTTIVYADGGSERNGSVNSHGYGSYKIDNGAVQRVEFGAGKTNNECEYMTLVAVLQAVREQGIRRARIYMDSQLVVEQVNGNWKLRAPALRLLWTQARALLFADEHELLWTPREQIVRQLGH